MSGVKKTVLGVTFVVAVGAAVYEAWQSSRLQEEIQTLRQQQGQQSDQIQPLQRERDEATNQVLALQANHKPTATTSEQQAAVQKPVEQSPARKASL